VKYLYLTLNWVFGVLFLLTGALSLVESPLAGLSLIAVAALLLPAVRNFVYLKTNKEFPVKARAISIFALLMASGFFIEQVQDRKEKELTVQLAHKKQEKAAQLRQENIDFFNANREEIIFRIKNAITEKDYQVAISKSNKYLVSGDKELKQLNIQAKNELSAIQKMKKTEKLLAELKSVPTKEYEKNQRLYQQLLNMHPDSKLYKNKVAFYTGKIKEEKQMKIAAKARKKKIESQFSSWDGSHHNLERVVKESMNDPDSYEHIKTIYWDRGNYLIVKTTFRGKNAFGGIVKNSVTAKVSLDGQVLQILSEN